MHFARSLMWHRASLAGKEARDEGVKAAGAADDLRLPLRAVCP